MLYQLALNGFYLDKFYTKICAKVYAKFSDFLNFFDVKVLANYGIVLSLTEFGVRVFNFIEEKIMNGTVNFVSKLFRNLSLCDLKAQSGNIQKYNAYAFIIITVVMICLILGYSLLIMGVGYAN